MIKNMSNIIFLISVLTAYANGKLTPLASNEARTQLLNCVSFIINSHFTKFGVVIVLEDKPNDIGEDLLKIFISPTITATIDGLQKFGTQIGSLLSQIKYREENIGYVFLLNNSQGFHLAIRKMKLLHFRPHSKFLIILNNGESETKNIRKIFDMSLREDIYNIIIVTSETDLSLSRPRFVIIYTYFPFGITHCRSVYTEMVLDQWIKDSFIVGADLFPNKLKNLQGCYVNISTFDLPPSSIVERNQEGNISIKGVAGNVLNTFADKINCTLSITGRTNWFEYGFKLRNGTYIGDMRQVKVGKLEAAFLDVSAELYYYEDFDPILSGQHRHFVWIVPLPSFYPDWMNVFFPLQPECWLLTVVLYFFVVVSVRLMKLLVQQKSSPMFEQPLLYYFSILLGWSVREPPRMNLARVVFLIWVFGSFIINHSYQASLFVFLTHPTKYPSINTMGDLVKSGLSLKGYPSHRRYFESSSDPVMKAIYNNFKFQQALTQKDWLLEVISGHNAYINIVSAIQYYQYKYGFIDSRGKPLVHIVPQAVASSPTVYLMRRNSPYVNTIARLIKACICSGLLSKWKDDVFFSALSSLESFAEDNGLVVITINHLLGLFALLISGLCLSILIFLVEMVFEHFKRKRTRTRVLN